jgi:acetoacetyl-CoA reductase
MLTLAKQDYMSRNMSNSRIAIVTGGTGDIGSAICLALSPLCKKVIAVDIIDSEFSRGWINKMEAQNCDNCEFHQLDVADFDQCERVLSKVIKQVGAVDYLVNNAGITRDAVFTKMTKKQWGDVLRVNLDGMFNVTRQIVGAMREQSFGRIINISSVNAQKGQFSQANYAASKAGIYGFTKSLSQELISKNITVNSISPGYVNTRLMDGIRSDILEKIIELIPAKRLAEPNEVAWVVEFLIHEKSKYITGANLSVNGGLHMY